MSTYSGVPHGAKTLTGYGTAEWDSSGSPSSHTLSASAAVATGDLIFGVEIGDPFDAAPTFPGSPWASVTDQRAGSPGISMGGSWRLGDGTTPSYPLSWGADIPKFMAIGAVKVSGGQTLSMLV
jgi:hypothetical protein